MQDNATDITIKQPAGRKPLDPVLYYAPKEVSAYLGVSEPTLAKWRCRKQGPSFTKVGRVISYRGRDLLAFEGRCRVATEGEAA